ncbi:MoaD/ThiS family protein [Dyella psychrodurans]|uniref:Thiamine biosynthesis protein ThiS n=1 Tax=Dyella psychrodurans TaxID=1927960 RepID=A0A370WY26_9GAMM|nr:MoaD/ThiS family protein [Dyella psychrodurans]RDS81022.1 thiamine biosynthesis protein ThiS [Dyella psychrodurans]
MKVRITLFGALRDADSRGYIELDMPEQSTIAALREALQHHVHDHAPPISAGLVQRSAFASEHEILHNHRTVPEDGQIAILPPVSGG